MESKSRGELVDLHLKLLELERREEKRREKQLAEDGASSLEVVVTDVKSENDVYVLTVTVQHRPQELQPKHCINKGSQVSVTKSSLLVEDLEGKEKKKKPKAPSAVVIEVTPTLLKLAFPYVPKISGKETTCGETVCIKQTASIGHTQLSQTMEWLKNIKTDRMNYQDEPAVPVVREMFKEHQQKTAMPRADVPPIHFIKEKLNESQRKAVKLALRDRPLTVIHGPPGTGKTTTLVEVILQHAQRGKRVLVCAPSNKAVDNLLEGVWKQLEQADCGLSAKGVLRLGNLARMEEKHRRFSPHLKVDKFMKTKELQRALPAQIQQMREGAMAWFLRNASVVMSTLTSVRSVDLKKTFDLLVIDECAQATEAACWLAIPFAMKVLLAGDPCQLPPTILSQEAAQRGLAVSLMERQMELHGEGVVHMLDTQHRMHELIQAWSSKNLYGGKLKAAPDVASHLLTGLPGVHSTKQTEPTLLLMDTAGCRLKETRDTKTRSYSNNGEANLVVKHARSLVEAGIQVEDIGVITPYKQQVALIESKMRVAGLDIEVNSVDGYQGREKEAILLSLVRSNEKRKVGFVDDIRRLNVAVTRARRQLFITCDTATLHRSYTIRSLVNDIKKNGEARSANCHRRPHRRDGHANDSVSQLAARLSQFKV